jgi:hypothetical protein
VTARNPARALALASAGAVLAAAGGGHLDGEAVGPAAAEASGCKLTLHAKRAGYRGSKGRRPRTRRWRTCTPIRAQTPPTPLGVPAYDTSNALCAGAEMCLRPTRTEVPAGRVAVELSNHGEDPHTLRISKVGGGGFFSIPADPDGEVPPGEQERLTFNLTAGEWYLFCSLGEGVDSHEALGMSANLTVDY